MMSMSDDLSRGAQSTAQLPSIETIKSAMRNTWMSGDFGKIAAPIAQWAVDFVHRVAPQPGTRVLDVACGTGNVTLPLARLGTMATGVDIAPNLLQQARERAYTENLQIAFDEGDAEALPYPDGSFHAVFSMFGAMFAPRPELVAAELARVLCPGGTLAMANWTPASFSAKLFSTTAKHVPPPPGVPSSLLWGEEAVVRSRLAGHFTNIRTEVVHVDFDLPMSPAEAAALFRKYFGPTKVAFAKLDEDGQAALGSDLDALWSGACKSPVPGTHTLIRNEYLQVIATRSY